MHPRFSDPRKKVEKKTVDTRFSLVHFMMLYFVDSNKQNRFFFLKCFDRMRRAGLSIALWLN